MNSKDSMYSWHLSLRVDRPVEVSWEIASQSAPRRSEITAGTRIQNAWEGAALRTRVFGCLGFRRWRELLGLSHSKDSSGYGKEIQPTNRPIAIGHTTTAQCSEGLNIVVLDINCRTQKWAHQQCTGIIKVQNAGEFSLLLYSRLGLTLDCYFGTLGQAYKAFGLATQPIEELYEMKIANPIPFALHR